MTGHTGIGDGGRLTARIALNRGTLQAVDAAIDKVRESQSLRRFGQDWATAPLVVARFLALAPGPLRGQWTVTRMPFGPLARAWMLVALWALAVTMRCLSPVATWRSRMLQRRVVGGVDGGGWCGERLRAPRSFCGLALVRGSAAALSVPVYAIRRGRPLDGPADALGHRPWTAPVRLRRRSLAGPRGGRAGLCVLAW